LDSEHNPDRPVESAQGASPADNTQAATTAAPSETAATAASDSSGETAEEKRARLMAEIKAKAAAKMASKGGASTRTETPAAPPATSPAPALSATPAAATGDAPADETPEEKRARIIAEAKAKAAAKMASKGGATVGSESSPATTTVPAQTVAANVPAAATNEVPAGTPPAARIATGAARTTPTAGVAKGIPQPVAAKQHPTIADTVPDPPINKMRRRIIWLSIFGFIGTSLLMFFRFFLPRTIFEPSSIFRVGFPGDYGVGVDTKYQQLYRVWVVKTSDRLFVINAVCTHLGCTPDWKASENKFKCPCHGSGYDSEGINFEGPAPRPMDRAHIELDAEGQIVVNKGRLYDWPKGGENKFEDPGAYIPL
jgi:cytochrome b6-f complex iron-sulfur subunit